jgi:hypothetical protein
MVGFVKPEAENLNYNATGELILLYAKLAYLSGDTNVRHPDHGRFRFVI